MNKGLAIAAGVGLLLLAVSRSRKARAAPQPPGTQATGSGGVLALRLVPVRGRLRRIAGQLLIGANAQLIEGAAYRLDATLTNISTRGGVLVPVTGGLVLRAYVGSSVLLAEYFDLSLAAGEVRTFSSHPFTVESPLPAFTGSLRGTASDSLGPTLADVTVPVDFVPASVIPSPGPDPTLTYIPGVDITFTPFRS